MMPDKDSSPADPASGAEAKGEETAPRTAESEAPPLEEQAGPWKSQPRGVSPAELDALRVAIKVAPRGQPVAPLPKASARPPPAAQAMMNRAEIDRIVDEGRALLDTDVKAAHEIFSRAWRRNLNDPRVLSNFGLTLVLVEGDRQRGIRFCEEALRRGLRTTEALVNLAKALVVTRNKEQAVRALRKAMELAPEDPRVGQEFVALGLRRRPAIPFLPRSFFLNRWIGMLTWKYLKRYRMDPLSRTP